MSAYIVVITTTNSDELAKNIAGNLVAANLAACVNIIPNILSVYKWKDAVCHDKEFLLLIKSRSEHLDAIRKRIRSLHTYELPEVVAIPILWGDAEYLRWIEETTKS